jgi:hypothetical protein
MYATLGLSMPSQHFAHAQGRSVIPEIEPPTRRRPLARVLDQASFDGIVVHVIQLLISLLRVPDVHSESQFRPQLAESRNPFLPKTLGVKQARAIPPCGMLLVI